MTTEELKRRVDELRPWHYCHIFPGGISTGDSSVPVQSEKLMLLVQAEVFSEPKYSQVLDLGSNSGLIAMWFADHKSSNVWCVENDLRFYAQLELAIEAKGYADQLFPLRDDVTQLVFKEGEEFDLILNLGLMHHIPQPKHAVVYETMFSVLRPGGLVVVQTKRDQAVLQHLRQAGFEQVHKVEGYVQGDRFAWTATKAIPPTKKTRSR